MQRKKIDVDSRFKNKLSGIRWFGLTSGLESCLDTVPFQLNDV